MQHSNLLYFNFPEPVINLLLLHVYLSDTCSCRVSAILSGITPDPCFWNRLFELSTALLYPLPASAFLRLFGSIFGAFYVCLPPYLNRSPLLFFEAFLELFRRFTAPRFWLFEALFLEHFWAFYLCLPPYFNRSPLLLFEAFLEHFRRFYVNITLRQYSYLIVLYCCCIFILLYAFIYLFIYLFIVYRYCYKIGSFMFVL